MPLNLFLKRTGIVTGPLAKNTSTSALEVIKNYLLSKPQFLGGPVANYGIELHSQLLVNKSSCSVLPEEVAKISTSLKKLRGHVVVKSLLNNSIREEKCYSELNKVPVAFILDIHKPAIATGADLKTTSCSTLQQCIDSCRSYGYFRQAVTYKKCARLKSFYFIFIQKDFPHNIFIVDLAAYPEDEKYAERELEFLLHFYKYYGNIIPKPTTTTNGVVNLAITKEVKFTELNKSKTIIKQVMAKSGKETLEEIKLTSKEYKEKWKLVVKSQKDYEKSKKKLTKLIDKFPAKEKELYAEKLNKFTPAE